MKRFFLSFAAVANLLVIDQFAKAATVFFLKGKDPFVVISGWLDLAYVENRGAAWGIFQGHVWPLAVFALVALAVVLWKRKAIFPMGKAGTCAEIFLYAGILGNLIDRIYLGYVVDMIDCHWGIHHFPCFNPADIYINIAAGLLILLSFFSPQQAPHPKSQS